MTDTSVQIGRRAAMSLGALEVRPSTLEVVWPGGRERLQPRMMEVLVVLGEAADAVVTRDELIATCWGGRAVSDDSINLVIAKLRKLSARTSGLFSIETIARVGYRLSAKRALAPGAAVASVADMPARLRPPRFAGVRLRLIGAACVIALVSAAGWILHAGAQTTASSEVVVETFAVTGPGLPDTFAADLREDMLTTFQPGVAGVTLKAGEPGLYRGAYRLRGRVESAAGHVDIYARLEPPDGSRILWSAHYETLLSVARPPAIGHEVIYGVNCLMGIVDGPHAPGLGSPAAPAWADYCVENARLFHADLDRELAALRRTVALEPKFFAANAYLGGQLSLAAARARPSARRALMEEGLASAMRAQRLEPGQGEGYMAEAVLRQDTDPARAEALFLKALSLRTSKLLWEAQPYSRLLERMGRIDEAAEQERRLLAVQPNNPFDLGHLAWDDAVRGRYDSAEQTLDAFQRQLVDPHCSSGLRLNVAVWARNWRAAQAIAHEPSGCGLWVGRVALVDALSSGDPAQIARARAQFETFAADPATFSRFTVTGLALTGDDKAAVAALGRLIDRDGASALPVIYEPSFAAVRRTPEFAAMATRYGLVSYWRTSGHAPDFCRGADAPDLCRRLPGPNR